MQYGYLFILLVVIFGSSSRYSAVFRMLCVITTSNSTRKTSVAMRTDDEKARSQTTTTTTRSHQVRNHVTVYAKTCVRPWNVHVLCHRRYTADAIHTAIRPVRQSRRASTVGRLDLVSSIDRSNQRHGPVAATQTGLPTQTENRWPRSAAVLRTTTDATCRRGPLVCDSWHLRFDDVKLPMIKINRSSIQMCFRYRWIRRRLEIDIHPIANIDSFTTTLTLGSTTTAKQSSMIVAASASAATTTTYL